MDMYVELRDRYDELGKVLKKIYNVKGSSKKNLSLDQMNVWIKEVILFYEKCGIKLSYDDFKDSFNENNSIYKKRNNHINRYMKAFFDNIDNLDSYDFSLVLLSYDDLTIKDGDNPILDEIVAMIINFNNKHKRIFNSLLEELKKKYSDLEIDSSFFTYDKIEDLLTLINQRIIILEEKINKLKEERKKAEDKDKEKNKCIEKIYELCMLITGNDYNRRSSDEKKQLINMLPYILDLIIKMRIFNELYDKYNEYNISVNYDEIVKIVKRLRDQIASCNKKIDEFTEKKDYLVAKNSIFWNNKKEVNRLNIHINEIDNEVRLKESNISHMLGNYFQGFYEKYDLVKLEEAFGVSGLDDRFKLFGVFDFEMLPVTSDKVNEMEELRKLQVFIPDMSSMEFSRISRLCLEIVSSNIPINDLRSEVVKKK